MKLYDWQGHLVRKLWWTNIWDFIVGFPDRRGGYIKCKFLAADSASDGFRFDWEVKGFVLREELKPITKRELPLYMAKKYKSAEFLELFQ